MPDFDLTPVDHNPFAAAPTPEQVASMTHAAPAQPQPYMHPNVPVAARTIADFAQGGLQGAGAPIPEWAAHNPVQEALQNPDNQAAMGIFGGQGAKTADLNKLVEAQRMFKEGVSNRQIWENTGWMMGPDTKWRFEIPDFGTTMLKKPTFGVATLDTAKDVLEHPDLYKAYPDLGDAWVRGMRSDAGNMGEYHAPGMKYPRDEIGIRNNLEDPRSTMLHELQHGVQAREGFDPGANTEVAGGYENYKRNIGEVEARNVQQRRNVPPQDLIYPRDTEDVPLLQQLHYAELPGVRSKSEGLHQAQQMQAKGASNRETFKATGWYRGERGWTDKAPTKEDWPELFEE